MKQASLTQLINARDGVSVLRLILAQQGEITPDTVVSTHRGITADDYLTNIYDEIQLVVDAMVEDLHPTVPLREVATQGEIAARDYLVKRSNAKRMGRPLQWVRFAPRLASQVADLPPLLSREGLRL